MDAQHEPRTARGFSGPRAEDRPVHRGLVFTIVALALLMMSIDATIVATALHALHSELQTSIDWAGWTITAYSLGFVVILPVTGKLSEQYGSRRVFVGSVAVFTLASLCCGLANNIYVLIALRGLQAAGGAGFTPSATEIIVDYFGNARDRAVGLLALRYVPRDRARTGGTHRRMDAVGMVLLGGGLLAGMLAASYVAEGNA